MSHSAAAEVHESSPNAQGQATDPEPDLVGVMAMDSDLIRALNPGLAAEVYVDRVLAVAGHVYAMRPGPVLIRGAGMGLLRQCERWAPAPSISQAPSARRGLAMGSGAWSREFHRLRLLQPLHRD